jgi:prepilin-type N-terminal cleavage/methylation domain-containing protein
MRTCIKSGKAGFTLIEVIITLCVFVLLAAAVFGIFSATLQSSSALQDEQSRKDSSEALGGWLRQSLLDIPASGTVASYSRQGTPFHVSGIVWGAGEDLQALDLQLQNNGQYTLRLATYQPAAGSGTGVNGVVDSSVVLSQFIAEVVRDDASLTWRPLVRDLKAADWRFRDASGTDWLDVASGPKPVLAEFTFQIAGTPTPVVEDYWIPPTQPALNPSAGALPAPAVTATP